MAKARSATSKEWQIAFFRAGGEVPGRAWLQTVDKDVRRQYLIWLAALRTWKPGPYALPASVPWWRAMKDEMKGIYEMRDQHGKTNYRLFCFVGREGARPWAQRACGGCARWSVEARRNKADRAGVPQGPRLERVARKMTVSFMLCSSHAND